MNQYTTNTADIVKLNFDRDLFYKQFEADPDSVKALIIGSGSNKGILTKVEELMESSLASVSGYFDTQTASYNKQIQSR